MRKLLLSLYFIAAFGSQAFANWTGKDATPATITFYNPGACTSVVCTPVVQLTDGTNQVTLVTVGADGVSNTLTGLPTYARMLQFNGTTWDRWQGAIKAASGSFVDGAIVTLGLKADAHSCTSASAIACLGQIDDDIKTGTGATGSATPSTTIYMGGSASGATGGLLQGIKQCDLHKLYDASTNGSTLLVTGISGRKILICGFLFGVGGTATNVKLVEGTTVTTPCDTSTTAVTPAYQLAANSQTGALSTFWTGLSTATAADNLCINASGANAVQADVWYTIQ